MQVKRVAALSLIAASLVPASFAGASPPRWYQPILALPSAATVTFECVIWRESRSTFAHPNLHDDSRYGSSGIFQIEQATWAAHQLAAGVPLSVHVWQATPYQQALVAVAIYRANGFGPWTLNDGC